MALPFDGRKRTSPRLTRRGDRFYNAQVQRMSIVGRRGDSLPIMLVVIAMSAGSARASNTKLSQLRVHPLPSGTTAGVRARASSVGLDARTDALAARLAETISGFRHGIRRNDANATKKPCSPP